MLAATVPAVPAIFEIAAGSQVTERTTSPTMANSTGAIVASRSAPWRQTLPSVVEPAVGWAFRQGELYAAPLGALRRGTADAFGDPRVTLRQIAHARDARKALSVDWEMRWR